MREIKFRAWDKINKQMLDHRNIGILLKNINNKSNQWVYMQHIGKKDKNGKEIYEKDIIIAPFNDLSNYGVIEFTECRFWLRSNLCKSLYDLYDFNSEDLEIIGNVFENPDLVDGWFK